MANYDAEVRVSTKVDTSQMQRLQMQIDKAAMKVEALTKKCEDLKNQQVPTEAFTALESKLQSAQAELQKLIAEENRLAGLGLTVGAPWDNIIQKEADAQLKIEAITAEMQKMKDAGTAFTGIDPEKIRASENELYLAKGNLSALVMKWDELNAKQDATAQKSRKVSDGLKRIGEIGKKAFSRMNSHAKKSSGLFHTMATRLKGILLSLLIFNWITKGFNNMVNGMKKGFKNLVLYSEEYNKSVSALKSANTQLQNSWAAAFMPIVQAAIPHLITLINCLTSAANAVAQFTAVMTGKSTWVKATAVQEDYAASLDGTAASAKKAAKALASFDTLEVLNKNDSSGGGSGTNPGDMFEEVPVDSISLDPKQLGEYFSNWLADGLENVDWDSIKDKSEEAGRNIARFLNGVWENERLAADIGMTIGETLNTAVRFAYGFIDENDWLQMGRFFGTLVQSGLDIFDEEKAGETAGKLVNGLADSIIGYFQTYEAGSLGSEIASFLNRAVEEVDTNKVGTSLSLMVGGLFTEVGSFFKDGHFEEIGRKISEILITALTHTENDKSAGNKAGEAIASILNSGVDFLLGADISGLEEALGSFITDILISAVENIDWLRVVKMLQKGATNLFDFPVEVGKGAGKSILRSMGIDNEEVDKAIDSIPTLGDQLGYLSSKVETLGVNAAISHGNIVYSAEALKKLQEQLGLTNSDVDFIIQSMIKANEQIDLSKLGLEGYAGSWADFSSKATVSMSEVNAERNKMVEETLNGVNALDEGFQRTSIFLTNKNEEMKSSTSSAREFIGQEHIKINESLNSTNEKAAQTAEKVSELSENAASSLSGVNSQYSETLDNMTSMTDEWFSGMSQYFSTEQWQQFSNNITGSMLGCLDTMTNDWTTMLDEWMIQNDEMYFGYDIWYEQFSNILMAYADVDAEFQSEWQANMDTWWNTMVTPFFEVAQWQLFGTNMKTGIMQGFKVIVNEIGGVLNNIIKMFDSAFKELEESMNDLIDSYNSSASVLGTSTLSRVHYKPMGGIKIPALADGAVIRGGNPFLAILGDQPSGQTNIEAPQGAIEEAVTAGLRRAGGNGGTLQINLNYDGETFARLSLKDILAEMDRQGYDIDVLGGLV